MSKKHDITRKRVRKKPVNKGGGYPGFRDPVTGLTEREMLYRVQRQRNQIKLVQERGDLILKSEAEAGMRECAEVIQSDLFGALPSRCATVLGGKKYNAEQVRQAVLKVVWDIVGNWIGAEIVEKEARPDESN